MKSNIAFGIWIFTLLSMGIYSDIMPTLKKLEDGHYVNDSQSSQSSSTQSSKYSGSHRGNWEGYLLNQYNNGSAQFSVQSNGRASLILSGRFSATHNGQVKGTYFITDKDERCSIVDLGGGRFKIVLIWTGVNVDVYF